MLYLYQVRFQIPYVVLDRCFASRLAWWRRKNDGVVKVLQIGIHALQYKFILGVLGYCCLKIVWDKVLGYTAIELNRVDCAFNKARQFLVKECFCVNKTAYSKCCRKEVYFLNLASFRI